MLQDIQLWHPLSRDEVHSPAIVVRLKLYQDQWKFPQQGLSIPLQPSTHNQHAQVEVDLQSSAEVHVRKVVNMEWDSVFCQDYRTATNIQRHRQKSKQD